MTNFETTICTCVEAGALETQVLLLAESLRRFGGRYARLPFYAVKPRAGPAISHATRNAFDRLGVTFTDERLNVDLAWWDHANKPATMAYAEQHVETPWVTWMDGDMAVLEEPLPFAGPDGAEFIARAGEAFDVASSGNDDGADYWHRLCAMFGLNFDDFQMITSFPDGKPIRAYWQTGLYSYRPSVRLGAKHLEIMDTLLHSNVASRKAGTYHTDQVSAALAVQSLGLIQAEYDPSMNFNFSPLAKNWINRLQLNEIRVLHYHGSLWPEAYGWTRDVLKDLPADRLSLIDRFAPLKAPTLATRVQRKIYTLVRSRKIRELEKRVERY